MSLKPFPIVASDKGLVNNVKPAMLPENAWAILENAYTYRQRELKREGRMLLGRLRRVLTSLPEINTPMGVTSYSFYPLSGAGIKDYITAATQANPCQITSPNHNLTNGDEIIIYDVVGMTELNTNTYTITVVDPDNFTLDVDSSLFGMYVSGGFWVLATQPNAEIECGSLVITIGAPDTATFTDNGDGTLTGTGAGAATGSYINYITGLVTLVFTAPTTGGATVTADVNYFPTLPVMGIPTRDLPAINDEQTIWFDTVYAYVWNGTGFDEFIPGTIWNGTNADFFWSYNYRGASAADRLMFTTNFINDANNPMRFTNGASWTSFSPLYTATEQIWQARIIIAYYGRLLLLNTWEGATASGHVGAKNFFNRCRFSELGDPTAADAYRVDIFGKGGSIDAPTNEAITGATFIKNTLVVDFERSTWQLRYVGEYGTPFIWERVSADFGSESTFSGVLFDNHRLAVGDKGITAATGNGVDRIDLEIPNQVFDFKNDNFGTVRVAGIRDFKRELVFWNYPDTNTNASADESLIYPNKVLLYNYRNNTWAIFRDSVTAWGTFQSTTGITWDSLSTFWDDYTVTWDNTDTQSLFPIIVCGDQQGFVSCYGYDSPSNISTVPAIDQETLTIQGLRMASGVLVIQSKDHNLQDGEIVYLSGMHFLKNSDHTPIATNLNDRIYQVRMSTPGGPLSKDEFSLAVWLTTTPTHQYSIFFPVIPNLSTATYVGCGVITLFPKLNILSKDINMYQNQSMQTKLSRLDFLFESVTDGSVTVNLYLNASTNGGTPGTVGGQPNSIFGTGNVVWNSNMSIDARPPYYTPGSDYSWFRYYATLAAQYFSINITYNDDLMNTLATHSQSCTLYAINAWTRQGGKNVY